MRMLGQLSAFATLGLALYATGFFFQFTGTADAVAVLFAVTLFLGLGSISALTLFALFVEAPKIEVLAIALNAAIAGPAATISVTLLAGLVMDRGADWGAVAVILEPCLIFGGLHACNALALLNSLQLRQGGRDVPTLLSDAVSRMGGSPPRPESRRVAAESRAIPRRSESGDRARRSAPPASRVSAPRPVVARREPPAPRPAVTKSILGSRWLMWLASTAALLGLVWFVAHDRLPGFARSPVSKSLLNAGPPSCDDIHVRGWRVVPEDDPNSFLLEITLQPKEKHTLRLESVSFFGAGNRSFARGTPLEPTGRAPNTAGDLTLAARFNPGDLVRDRVVQVSLTVCAGPDSRACQRLYYGQVGEERGPCELPPATDVPAFMARLGP
jgi:hypothetical protein